MREYHKIDSVFKRDPATNFKTFLPGQYSQDAFEYLSYNQWTYTEKVDGTNIRVMINGDITFGGKTDAASIPAPLVNRLQERFFPRRDQLTAMFSDGGVCLYGEGYGAKIQKGGGNYRPDQDFVLFDINVGGWWLQRKDVELIGETLGLDVVPIIGQGSLHHLINVVRDGFNSTWGPFAAEGIVARPVVELKNRDGSRIITKLKHKDFVDLRQKEAA